MEKKDEDTAKASMCKSSSHISQWPFWKISAFSKKKLVWKCPLVRFPAYTSAHYSVYLCYRFYRSILIYSTIEKKDEDTEVHQKGFNVQKYLAVIFSGHFSMAIFENISFFQKSMGLKCPLAQFATNKSVHYSVCIHLDFIGSYWFTPTAPKR